MTHKYVLPACLAVASLIATAPPAAAIALYCSATGTGANGAFTDQVVVFSVASAAPAQLATFNARLTQYVLKQDPAAREVNARCVPSEDAGAATTRYTMAVQDAAIKLGWEHINIVRPEEWLPAEEITDSSAHP